MQAAARAVILRAMSAQLLRLSDLSEKTMQAFAVRLSKTLGPGDVLLLIGDVGAGKTTFARAIIQSLLSQPEDVPSPTFTLVQTYETEVGDVWHCDLYRLSDPFELEELGLTEAFDTAICLIEWPEILGEATPSTALNVRFQPSQDGSTRTLTFEGNPIRWAKLSESVDA